MLYKTYRVYFNTKKSGDSIYKEDTTALTPESAVETVKKEKDGFILVSVHQLDQNGNLVQETKKPEKIIRRAPPQINQTKTFSKRTRSAPVFR